MSVYISKFLDRIDFPEACSIFILTQQQVALSESGDNLELSWLCARQEKAPFSNPLEFPAAKSLFNSAARDDTYDLIFNGFPFLMYYMKSSLFRSPWLVVAIRPVIAFIFVTWLLGGQ